MTDFNAETLATTTRYETPAPTCRARHDVLDEACGERLDTFRETVKVGSGRSFQRVAYRHQNSGWKHEARA